MDSSILILGVSGLWTQVKSHNLHGFFFQCKSKECEIFFFLNTMQNQWLLPSTHMVYNLPSMWPECSVMSWAAGSHPLAAHQALLKARHWIHYECQNSEFFFFFLNIRERSLTCFFCTDRQLFAWKATAYLVVGIHADAVHTSRVQLDNVGLVVGGWDVSGCVHMIPGV